MIPSRDSNPDNSHLLYSKRTSFILGLVVGVVLLEASPYSWRPPLPDHVSMQQMMQLRDELSLQFISWPCCEPCAGTLTPRQKGVLGWSEAIVLPRTAHSWLAQAPGFLQPFWSQLAACTRVPSVVPLFTMSRQ